MAVYTEIDDAALQAFVAEYDIGGVIACKGIERGLSKVKATWC